MATYNVPGLPKVTAPTTTARKDAYTNPKPLYDPTAEIIQSNQSNIMNAVAMWQKKQAGLDLMYKAEDDFYLKQMDSLNKVKKTGNQTFDDSVYNVLYETKNKLVAGYRDYYKDRGNKKDYLKQIMNSNKVVANFNRVITDGIVHGIAEITEALKNPQGTTGALSKDFSTDEGLMLLSLAGRNDIKVEIIEEDGEFLLTTPGGKFDVGGTTYEISKDAKLNLNEFADNGQTNAELIPTIPDNAESTTNVMKEVVTDPDDPGSISGKYIGIFQKEVKTENTDGTTSTSFVDRQKFLDKGKVINPETNEPMNIPETIVAFNDGMGQGITYKNPQTFAVDERGNWIKGNYADPNDIDSEWIPWDGKSKKYQYQIDRTKLKGGVNSQMSGFDLAVYDGMMSGGYEPLIADKSTWSEVGIQWTNVFGETVVRNEDGVAIGTPGNMDEWRGVTNDNNSQVPASLFYYANKSMENLSKELNVVQDVSEPYREKTLTLAQQLKLDEDNAFQNQASTEANELYNELSNTISSAYTGRDGITYDQKPKGIKTQETKTLDVSRINDLLKDKKIDGLGPVLEVKQLTLNELEGTDFKSGNYLTNAIEVIAKQPTFTREQIFGKTEEEDDMEQNYEQISDGPDGQERFIKKSIDMEKPNSGKKSVYDLDNPKRVKALLLNMIKGNKGNSSKESKATQDALSAIFRKLEIEKAEKEDAKKLIEEN